MREREREREREKFVYCATLYNENFGEEKMIFTMRFNNLLFTIFYIYIVAGRPA